VRSFFSGRLGGGQWTGIAVATTHESTAGRPGGRTFRGRDRTDTAHSLPRRRMHPPPLLLCDCCPASVLLLFLQLQFLLLLFLLLLLAVNAQETKRRGDLRGSSSATRPPAKFTTTTTTTTTTTCCSSPAAVLSSLTASATIAGDPPTIQHRIRKNRPQISAPPVGSDLVARRDSEGTKKIGLWISPPPPPPPLSQLPPRH